MIMLEKIVGDLKEPMAAKGKECIRRCYFRLRNCI
jgi:hypothetical protein